MQVCDFGLSRVLAAGKTHVSTQPHGTATHLAPEVWAEGHVSQPADVYAFGITRECGAVGVVALFPAAASASSRA